MTEARNASLLYATAAICALLALNLSTGWMSDQGQRSLLVMACVMIKLLLLSELFVGSRHFPIRLRRLLWTACLGSPLLLTIVSLSR